MFYRSSDQRHHIRDVHGMDSNTYKAKHGVERMMTKEVKFKCHLCGMTMQWIEPTLSYHAKSRHDMSLQQLQLSSVNLMNDAEAVERHENDEAGEADDEVVVADSEVLEDNDEVVEVDNEVVEVDSDLENGPPGGKGASKMSYKEWISGSEYKCRQCGKIFHKYMGLYGHLRFSHQLSIAEYRAKHNNLPLITKSSEMTCLCGRKVKRNIESLREHVKTTHNMSPKDLYDKLCKRGGVIDTSSPEKHRKTSTGYFHLNKWASGCQYKCLECGKVFHSQGYFGNHLRVKHNLSIQEYKKAHKVDSVMTKRKHFTCNLCSSVILHNPTSLKIHARTKHQMSLTELRHANVTGTVARWQ